MSVNLAGATYVDLTAQTHALLAGGNYAITTIRYTCSYLVPTAGGSFGCTLNLLSGVTVIDILPLSCIIIGPEPFNKDYVINFSSPWLLPRGATVSVSSASFVNLSSIYWGIGLFGDSLP
jgi:hypothetical protein